MAEIIIISRTNNNTTELLRKRSYDLLRQENASWVNKERQIAQSYNQMQNEPFIADEFSRDIQDLHNWEFPGSEDVYNF